ncbi:TonB-dependent receptor [Chitinophaga pendula]|uniref:TonB-dependent receptor n=1 Tax=Chitinophaga TaxID=79328 RepID=UPI000BAF9B4E|nr:MULTISPECIES: TonB-dependent receptor [Chitinophaga]ASZ11734.1 TonB-dependent siderophore receptor [Chitinophaga sp. MD30]UCJ05246.1 TonB-dependent receptor [Chitinophaga pendula]
MKQTVLLLLLVCTALVIRAQHAVVKGTIITSEGKPAAFITVGIEGTRLGAVTSDEGTYIINNIKPGNYTVKVTGVGIKTQERTVSLTPGQTLALHPIILAESAKQLREVIIQSMGNKFSRKYSEHVARISLRNLENAQVYTVVSKELLQDQMSFTLEDATRNMPGVYQLLPATGRNTDGGAYFSSRGFYLQGQLRNGVTGFVNNTVDAANLERIEAIKGPSGTLFGSALTSFGGLINRVTKKPNEKRTAEVAYSAGSFNFHRITADVNTPLDQQNKWLFRTNVAYNRENRFQANGRARSLLLAPSLLFQPSDRLSILLDAEIFLTKSTTPQIVFFNASITRLGKSRADELKMDYNRSYISSDLTQQINTGNFFAQVTYKLSEKWKSQTNFATTNNKNEGPQLYFMALPHDSLGRLIYNDNSRTSSFHIQQNFTGDFHIGTIRNRALIGIDVFSSRSFISLQTMINSRNRQSDYFDTISLTQPDPAKYAQFNKANVDNRMKKTALDERRSAQYTYSAYISDVVNITDRLIANLGLRIDHFDNKGTYYLAADTTLSAYTQTVLSPKFGLVFQPVKDKVSLFANYQNGFQNANGRDRLGKTFKPQQANQWETGVKIDLLHGSLSGTFSYYDISLKNVLRMDPVDPKYQIQDGTQRSKGFEAEIISEPVAGLNIVAGYAYNESKMTQSDASVLNRRPTSAGPANQANLWLSYQQAKGKLKGLGLGVGGNYASENKIINDTQNGVFTLPGYTVMQASVFYNKAAYKLGVKVDNLTNQQYWIGWSGLSAQSSRRLIASLTVRM